MMVMGGSGRYPFHSGNHVIVAAELWVHGDESGIGKEHRYTVVAGLMASPKHWDDFDPEWAKIISEAEVREFSAADFFNRWRARKSRRSRNQFKDWSAEKARKFINDLIDVIGSHRRITPIGTISHNRDFFSYSWGERNYITGATWNNRSKKFVSSGSPSSTYHLPFFLMVADALQRVKPEDAKVHFRMDEQAVIQNNVQSHYAAIRQSPRLDAHIRTRIGDLHPGLSEEHPGIQASDLIAHLWYSAYIHQERLAGERLEAAQRLGQFWPKDPFSVASKGMELILAGLTPEDRQLVRDFPLACRTPTVATSTSRGT